MSFYTIIEKGATHYRMGLNDVKFSGRMFSLKVARSGIFFTTVEHIYQMLGLGTILCKLSIPEGAQVVRKGTEYRADKICIEEKFDLCEVDAHKYLCDLGAKCYYLLSWAVRKRYDEIVKFAVTVSSQMAKNTALVDAVRSNQLEMVKFLVEKGAHIAGNLIDPVHDALRSRYFDIAKYLIEAESHPGWRASTFSLVCRIGMLEIVEFLVEKGIKASESKYALAQACKGGHLDVVKYLVKNGADIQAGNCRPLRWASTEEITDFLLEQLSEKYDTDQDDY